MITQFNETNFSMWKSKAKRVRETKDCSMLSIINYGPHIPMYQTMKENVKNSDPIEKLVHEFNVEDKHLVALDVKTHATIGNTLPYNIYHYVWNCRSTKEIMNKLRVAYEGNDKFKFTKKDSLNSRYDYFFEQKMNLLVNSSII